MKLTRKLIPALAMLLISAIVATSASYAWFTMNSSVTATGMQIKAQSSSNLLIAHTADATAPADSAYLTTAALAGDYTTPKSLAPGSTVDLANWYTSTASTPTAYTSGGTYGAGALNTNYISENLWLKSGADCNIYLASAAISGTGVAFGHNDGNIVGKFYNSIRVGVLMSDGAYRIYALDAGTASSAGYDETNKNGFGYGTVSDSTGRNQIPAEKFTAMTLETGTTYTADTTATFGSLAANVGKMAKVFIWFEGEDGSCYTNNISLSDVSINLTFAKVDIVP